MLIVRRYLAQDPDMEASQALLRLVNEMTKMDKESFIGVFGLWHERYKDVLNERSDGRRMKTLHDMCPRLCSVYLSIMRNMPWSWTFYDYANRGIPNTNNGIEGVFSDIKAKVSVHSGLTKEHRSLSMNIYQGTIDTSHPTFCLIDQEISRVSYSKKNITLCIINMFCKDIIPPYALQRYSSSIIATLVLLR